MRKKLKTSSRKPENVIKFGASHVGKIYGKAAKEQMNSLKHGVRSRCCSSHGGTGWVLDNTARSSWSIPGQQEEWDGGIQGLGAGCRQPLTH